MSESRSLQNNLQSAGFTPCLAKSEIGKEVGKLPLLCIYSGTSVFERNSFLRAVQKPKSSKTETIFPRRINVK